MTQPGKAGMGTYRSIYSIVDHIRERGLVLYGAGAIGKIAVQIFALFQVKPAYFCDDDLQKQGSSLECDGISVPIISLDEATRRLPGAVYIATAATGKRNGPRDRMKARLKERNLLSQDSGFYPLRYLFLLDGGLEALERPEIPSSSAFTPERLENIVLFSSMGRSGTMFFDMLMDGHPNVLNIGGIGTFAPLKSAYLNQLQYLEGTELVIETARHMQAYLASQVVHQNLLAHYRNSDGEFEERIYISPAKFVSSLSGMLMGQGYVSFGFLFKAIFAAYHNAIGKPYIPGQTYWIFFETHRTDCDTTEYDGLLLPRDFKRLEHWVIIREPVQQFFSAVQHLHQRLVLEKMDGSAWIQGYYECFSGSLGIGLERNTDHHGKVIKVLRFEDAKRQTYETMRAVCKWMDIEFDKSMLETTINGIVVYFPSAVTDKKKTISARDTTAVDRHDFSAQLSAYDVFRLNFAFQNVKRAYGYDCDMPDYRGFSETFLEELFQEPFRYEEWMTDAYAQAQKQGCLGQGKVDCHSGIANIILSYFNQDRHELITDMIRPEGDA